ncbi:MAG: alpha/beta fold hydrolase [Alphaproteobacteria bacterium]|nr:MAG: alpha/beta fold hydrolase [Alphaproteobacteria bacterium]
MKWLWRILGGCIMLYIGMAVLVYVAQDRLMFHFAPVNAEYQYQFESEHADVWLDNGEAKLHGILFKTPDKPRGVVVYYKGNAGNVGWSESMSDQFQNMGFDVLSMDYRGFGKSRGELSYGALLADAEMWFDWAADQYGAKNVRVVGYSLGTTFASHVAAARNVGNVILFAPMKSIEDIAERRYPFLPSFLAAYPFRNDEELARAPGRLIIYHGTRDDIIPFASGEELTGVLGDDDVFIRVEGATHYDLPWRNDVQDDVARRWGVSAARTPARVLPPAGAGLSIETARPS